MDTEPRMQKESRTPEPFATVREALRASPLLPSETRTPIRSADLEPGNIEDAQQINAMRKADYVGRAFLGDNYNYSEGSIWDEPRKTLCNIYEQLSEAAMKAVISKLGESATFHELITQYGHADKLGEAIQRAIQRCISNEGMNLEAGIGNVFEGKGHWDVRTDNSIPLELAGRLIPADRADQNLTSADLQLARQLLAEQLYGGVYDITGAPAEYKQRAAILLRTGMIGAMKKAAEHMEHTMRQDKNRHWISRSMQGVAAIDSSSAEMDTLLTTISRIASELFDNNPDLTADTSLSLARQLVGVDKQSRLVSMIKPDKIELLPARIQLAMQHLRDEVSRRTPQPVKDRYQEAKGRIYAWAADTETTGRSDFRYPVDLPESMQTALNAMPEGDRRTLTDRLTEALRHPMTFQEGETATPAFINTAVAVRTAATLAGAVAGTVGIISSLSGADPSASFGDIAQMVLVRGMGPIMAFAVPGTFYREIGNIARNKAVINKRGADLNAFLHSEGIMK